MNLFQKMMMMMVISSTNNKAKETRAQRAARIAGTGNGATLRTQFVPDKHKYSRKIKHKSLAEARDFAFLMDNFTKYCYIVQYGKHYIERNVAGRQHQGL